MEAAIYKENHNKKTIVVAAAIMLFIGAMMLSRTHSTYRATMDTAIIKTMAAWSDSTWTRRW